MIRHHPSWRFGPNNSIAWLPKFYYGGSKRHKLPSDLEFIFKYLDCLPEDRQKEASEKYDEIFKRHVNSGQLRKARYEANKFLQDFVKGYHKPGTEPEKTEKPKESSRLKQWISKTRNAQDKSRPGIDLGDKNR